MELRRQHVDWKKSHRCINSKWPPVHLFEEVADPADWEFLLQLEGKTADRVAEAGNFQSIPVAERRAGPGSTPVMAAFSYALPGRFNPPEFGAYYAADTLLTALRERAYHAGNFHRNSARLAGTVEDCRVYVGRITGFFTNVKNHADYHDPLDYRPGQQLAVTLREKGHDGVLYRSVRNPGGQCLAALRPRVVQNPVQGPHFALHFDGQRIDYAVNYADGAHMEL